MNGVFLIKCEEIMKNKLFLLGSLCLVLTACDTSSPPSTSKVPADNTERNVRDRQNSTLTAGDQSESAADRAITQKIRQLIVKEETLSVNGKNVKIVTINGKVTLRGPVETEKEKAFIGSKAREVSGVTSVDNQLEVR